jgi:hypothetical protein
LVGVSRSLGSVALIFVLVSSGCSRSDAAPDPASKAATATAPGPSPSPPPTPSAQAPTPQPAPTASATAPTPATSGPARPLVLLRGLRFIHAGQGDDLAKIVKAERERERADGRDLVVYVGAKWCEPCQRFHAAAERGELDADFPSLTLLEMDLDVDRERLMSAGYESELIPLFVLPGADGRATNKRFEGSVKGDRAVSNIAPRLRGLLAK